MVPCMKWRGTESPNRRRRWSAWPCRHTSAGLRSERLQSNTLGSGGEELNREEFLLTRRIQLSHGLRQLPSVWEGGEEDCNQYQHLH